jgi:protein HIRA/HIR1
MNECKPLLRGHTSFVKGVAWDPIGKFLATQADDKSCIIWRVDDWSIVSRITEPYQASMGATFSLRLCWSPDGKAVTTCNSYKKPVHCASVLERGDWGSKFDFVGHKGPVVAVRFSPALFGSSDPAKVSAVPHTVIACGSQDCKLTVWATNRPKPVCIIKTCFTQSVVDLCWSPDGYSLIACSTDGTLAVFTFEAGAYTCPLSRPT